MCRATRPNGLGPEMALLFQLAGLPKNIIFRIQCYYDIEVPVKKITSWWLNQPIWKILVKLDHFPQVGVKIENIWVATTQIKILIDPSQSQL